MKTKTTTTKTLRIKTAAAAAAANGEFEALANQIADYLQRSKADFIETAWGADWLSIEAWGYQDGQVYLRAERDGDRLRLTGDRSSGRMIDWRNAVVTGLQEAGLLA